MKTAPFVPRFLLAVDGSAPSDSAARHLADTARQLPGSHVDVLHVRDSEAGGAPLSKAASLLHQAGVAFELLDLHGDPATTILRCSNDRPVSEIVIGSRGLGRWSGLMVGSVAMKVAHLATVPVTVVGVPAAAQDRMPGPADPKRVLLAVDGSPSSLHAAAYLCALHAAGMAMEIELATVVGPLPPPFLQATITPEKLQLYYREEGEHMMRDAAELLEEASIPVYKYIEAGFIIDKLMQVASTASCQRMVLGSRGDSRISSLLLGSVAYQALHLSTVPVTLVR